MSQKLTVEQMDLLVRIQDGIQVIANAVVGINRLVKASGVELKPISAPGIGMLAHEIDGVLFGHSGDMEREEQACVMRKLQKKAA